MMRVDQDVLAVLSRAETNNTQVLLTMQLDRPMYVRVNKVIEAAGGKWNRKAKAHVFETDAAGRIDDIILTGEVEVPKDEFNFFETPRQVGELVMSYANVTPGMQVLEPSAGRGALAELCSQEEAQVMCVELMDANCRYLEDEGFAVYHDDFLTMPPVQVYDRVVMNPPFAKQADIRHVNHALRFLKPDGLLVAVMSAGITFRENKLAVEFRDMVAQRGGFFEDLPDGSFKESGTMVNTVIVIIPGEA